MLVRFVFKSDRKRALCYPIVLAASITRMAKVGITAKTTTVKLMENAIGGTNSYIETNCFT
jgi:hypothetical protein